MATKKLTRELWKAIPGYERYEASTSGRIRSVDRVLKSGKLKKGRILKQSNHSAGYKCLMLGANSFHLSHYLILLTFVGRRPVGYEVSHEDDNRANNRLDNLSYATPADNTRNKVKNGRQARGERAGGAKLKKRQVITILTSNKSNAELARRYNVHAGHISSIRRRVTWAWVDANNTK